MSFLIKKQHTFFSKGYKSVTGSYATMNAWVIYCWGSFGCSQISYINVSQGVQCHGIGSCYDIVDAIYFTQLVDCSAGISKPNPFLENLSSLLKKNTFLNTIGNKSH